MIPCWTGPGDHFCIQYFEGFAPHIFILTFICINRKTEWSIFLSELMSECEGDTGTLCYYILNYYCVKWVLCKYLNNAVTNIKTDMNTGGGGGEAQDTRPTCTMTMRRAGLGPRTPSPSEISSSTLMSSSSLSVSRSRIHRSMTGG